MAQRVRVLATLVEYQGSELSGASAPGPPGTTSRLCRHCLCTRCANLSISRHRCSCVLLVENKAITLFFLRVVCQWHSWELLPSYSTHYLLSRAFEDNNKARTASLQLTSSQLGLCIPHPCSWSCEQRLCAWQWEEQLALCDVIQTREVAWKTDRWMGQEGTDDDIHWLLKVYYFGLLRKIVFSISDWNFFATVCFHISF